MVFFALSGIALSVPPVYVTYESYDMICMYGKWYNLGYYFVIIFDFFEKELIWNDIDDFVTSKVNTVVLILDFKFFYAVELGRPRESFLVINPGARRSSANFCMADRNAYYWQYIEILELSEVILTIKF